MTTNLTAEQLVTLQLRIMSALSFYRQRPEKEARRMADLLMLAGAAASELQEHRKADAELKAARDSLLLPEKITCERCGRTTTHPEG